MSSGMSDYLALALQDHTTGVASYAQPTQLNVALWTARGTVAQSNAGTTFTECSGFGYARVNMGVGSTNWDAAVLATNLRRASNKLAIAMGTPSGGSWGTVAGLSLYDQSGNLLWWSDLTAPKACPDGVPVSIPIGDLDLTLPHGV